MANDQKLNIAIIDDHKMIRQVLSSFLSKSNYSVCATLDSCNELIEQIEQHGLMPDLCIVDIFMPEMNGLEITKLLKKNWPCIKVLAMSADLAPSFDIIRMGADGFITKDFTVGELSAAIDGLFQSKDH